MILGSTEVDSYKFGASDVDAIYMGGTLVWSPAPGWTINPLVLAENASASSSTTSPSFTPTPGALLCVAYGARTGGTPHSVTDTNSDVGSWTTLQSDNGAIRGSLSYALVGPSPSSCTVTVTHNSVARKAMVVFEVLGGTTVVQGKAASGASGTAGPVTLDSTPNASSLVVAANITQAAAATLDPQHTAIGSAHTDGGTVPTYVWPSYQLPPADAETRPTFSSRAWVTAAIEVS